MKNKTSFLKIAILASLFFLLTMWEHVSAAVNQIPNYGWCCGGTAAFATVRALAMNPAQGSCDITSETSPLTTINIIGWTWWQCETQDNNGNIIDYSTRPPRGTPPASKVSDLTQANYCNYFFSPPKCGYRLKAHGNHDFNHTGATQWRPYNSVIGP